MAASSIPPCFLARGNSKQSALGSPTLSPSLAASNNYFAATPGSSRSSGTPSPRNSPTSTLPALDPATELEKLRLEQAVLRRQAEQLQKEKQFAVWECKERVRSHQATLQTVKQEHSTTLARLKEQHAAELANASKQLFAEHATELATVREQVQQEHSAEVDRVRQQLQNEHVTLLASIRQQLQTEHAAELARVQGQLQDQQAESKQLQQQLHEQSAQSKQLHATARQLQDNMQQLQAEGQEAQRTESLQQQLKQQAEAHAAEVAKLRQALKEATGSSNPSSSSSSEDSVSIPVTELQQLRRRASESMAAATNLADLTEGQLELVTKLREYRALAHQMRKERDSARGRLETLKKAIADAAPELSALRLRHADSLKSGSGSVAATLSGELAGSMQQQPASDKMQHRRTNSAGKKPVAAAANSGF